jgi:hypothetical protein
VGVQTRRARQPVPFALMVTAPALTFVVVVPVALRPIAFMVVAPITSRPTAVVTRVMPLRFTPVTLFPLSMPLLSGSRYQEGSPHTWKADLCSRVPH